MSVELDAIEACKVFVRLFEKDDFIYGDNCNQKEWDKLYVKMKDILLGAKLEQIALDKWANEEAMKADLTPIAKGR